jgi:hypothetical protein
MPTVQIETEQLLNAALQMPRGEMEQFVRRLLVLKAQEETPCLTTVEAEILGKIERDAPPAARRRLNELIKQRQAGRITPAELGELIQLTNEAKDFNAERLKHLIELASLRDVSLERPMAQLNIKPVPHD